MYSNGNFGEKTWIAAKKLDIIFKMKFECLWKIYYNYYYFNAHFSVLLNVFLIIQKKNFMISQKSGPCEKAGTLNINS